MGWRTVFLERPGKAGYFRGNLRFDGDGPEPIDIPVEDLDMVVIGPERTALSAHLLVRLSEAGVAMVVCGNNFSPAGMLLPVVGHGNMAAVHRLQLSMSRPFCKRVWQRIVQQKIRNQAMVLTAPTARKVLVRMAGQVVSGDSRNVEAAAARYYWQHLFKNYRRSNREDPRNMALNYGYGILRSALARSVVAAGLLPSVGLHHDKGTNPFNLVDDLLEPFRPIVDTVVADLWSRKKLGSESGRLTRDTRLELVRILSADCKLDGERSAVAHACHRVPKTLVAAMEAKDRKRLLLPEPITDGAK